MSLEEIATCLREGSLSVKTEIHTDPFDKLVELGILPAKRQKPKQIATAKTNEQ